MNGYKFFICMGILYPVLHGNQAQVTVTWNSWGNWGSCTVSCGTGTRERSRTCPVTDGCTDGSSTESDDCNTNTCPPPERSLGQTCTDVSQCSAQNVQCTGSGTKTCNCQSGYYPNNNNCEKRTLGQTCTGAFQCSAQNVQCTGSGTQTCSCLAGYYSVSNDCKKRYLDQSCSADSHCSPVTNSECSSLTCSCKSGYYQSGSGSQDTCTKRYLGESCSADSHCSQVTNGDCISFTCLCKSGYYQTGTGSQGTCTKRYLDQSCTASSQCSVANGECSSLTCSCQSGYYKTGSGSTGTCTKRYLGESCSADSHCSPVTNGDCRSLTCSCKSGYYQSGSGSQGTCTKRYLGESCSTDSNCSPVTNGDCISFTCSCKSGYYKTGSGSQGTCTKRYLGESCSTDSNCSPVTNGDCISFTCSCKSGYFQSGSGSQGTCTKRYLGESCSADSHCSPVINGDCISFTCSCKSGYYQTGTGSQGTCTKRYLDQSCTASSQCSVANGECSSLTCSCQSGYYKTGSGSTGTCTKRSLGQTCTEVIQCSSQNVQCTGSGTNTCSCKTGYVQVNNDCLKTGALLADPPVNLEITGVTSRGFIISWEEPEEVYSAENFGYVLQITDDKNMCVQEIIYRCSDCIGSFHVSNLNDMCSLVVRSEMLKSKTELQGNMLHSANLDPDNSYNVTVTAITDSGRGYPAFKVKRTMEEVPQVPYSVTVTEIGTTSIKVSWNIDGPRPGKTNFTVRVIAVNPAQTKEFMITGFNTRSYLVGGLEEYWNYSITVTASTSVGAKTSDETQEYRTKPAAPGKVSDLKITETFGGIYTFMQISWRAPAILLRNSVIKEYSLVTSSIGTTAKKQSLSQESFEDHEYTIVVNVIPEANYTFQVYATNIQDMNGEVTTVVKQAPAGVPVNIEDTLQVDIISLHRMNYVGERRITVTLVQDFFEEATNGQIQASGLIVCAKDCKFEGIKALLDFNTVDNWQQASQKGFTLYRVTNPTWLDELKVQCGRRKRAVTNVEYTVGGEDCSDVSPEEYCNGPLHPGTSYHLVAVTCTNGGCLLSRQYGPFITAAEDVKTTTMECDCSANSIIIGVVLGVIILILLVYAGYATFLIRRLRQNGGEEINAARKNDRKSQMYVNESFVVGGADAGDSTHIGTFSDAILSNAPIGESDNEYSRLDENTREDRSTYDIIQSSRRQY